MSHADFQLIIWLGFAVLITLVWSVITYNKLVHLRNLINESWSNVDTELRRRYDLIPNLIEVVKGYAIHERNVLESVTKARAEAMNYSGPQNEQASRENQLIHSIKDLLAVSENYPELKADQQFLKLQRELVNTEDRIQAARRFYNGNVRDYNNLALSFPSSIIAGCFGFTRANYFEIEEAISRAVASVFSEHSKNQSQNRLI